VSPREEAEGRSKLSRRLSEEVRRLELLQPGQRVAVACSGGADSVGLLRLLDDLREPLGLRLFVAHLNHKLRGAESDGDEALVRRLAEALGLECIAERVDVAAQARSRKLNLEEAGRQARREFFETVLRDWHADAVALAHTLDDQAETVLARLLRGSGTRGLAGVYPTVELAGGGRLVRPLLSVRREELRDYLRARGQPWREDASNFSRERLRNQLRLDALPLLERLAGPHIFDHLGRLAEQAREEESFWAAVIEEDFRKWVVPKGSSFELPVAALVQPGPSFSFRDARQAREARRAVARRFVRRIFEAVRGDLKRITQTHVDSVLLLAEAGQSGQRVVLPGVEVERRFDRLVFAPPPQRATSTEPYRLEVTAPGVVRLPWGGALAFKLVGVTEAEKSYNCRQGAADASRASFPLVVRPWQAGDRYQPAGTAKERKLKELFQQGRVPVKERHRTPVVLCRGEIVWVPRWGVAAGYRVTPSSQTALLIEERAEA
jgi:tRNA(Ile)-lysidine synthase